MPKLSLQYIIRMTAGTIQGDVADADAVSATGYAFDTRDLQPGDLFFALPGERRDGHLFVKDACARGAAGAVVERPVDDVPATFPQVVVPSSLEALQVLAARVRAQTRIPVVAVSGSNGKTTTKEMLAAILSVKMRVHKSPGNFNNHIGVPMSILGLDDEHDVLVVELGSNHRGEIAMLSRIASPTVGILTNVGPAHIGHFGSLREIALEKTDLLRNLAEGGRGVVNGDDRDLLAALDGVEAQITRFGTGEGLEYRACDIQTHDSLGSTFRVGDAQVRLRAPGVHNVYNAVAAIAAAALFEIRPSEAATALEGFQSIRMKTFSFGRIKVIDDTYNANPDSVAAALELLAAHPATRRIFVMGEMLELGQEADRLHRKTGGKIAASGVDLLIAVGGKTQAAVAGALAGGMAPDQAVFFDTRAEAGAFLAGALKGGDVVLIKGSRRTGLDEMGALMRQTMVEGRA